MLEDGVNVSTESEVRDAEREDLSEDRTTWPDFLRMSLASFEESNKAEAD